MAAAQLAVRIAELIIFGALTLASLQRWRQRRDPAGVWAAATFGVLAFVVLASFVLSTTSESEAASWERKVLVAVLLLFPYFLFRYMAAFVKPPARLHRLAEALTAAAIVWTMLLPHVGGENAPRTTAIKLFTIGILIQWSVLSGIAGTLLWRAGQNQASVARNRMRMLALGTGLLNLALIFAAFVPGDRESASPLITGIMAIVSAVFFFVAFVPPTFLRLVWRNPDIQTLRAAELGLMSVLDTSEIGNALLPHVTRLFGAQGSVLIAVDGTVQAVSGLNEAEATATALVASRAGQTTVVEDGLVAVPISNGWLAVRGSNLSPFFGRDEVELLAGLGVFADLALERGKLFLAEREARKDAERANAELETFVYSVSHDLKSPLVSLLGFLDYLKAEVDGTITEEGRFFLERISAASMYMQALIQDLLELSRIGRVQTEATAVDLALVLSEVAPELEAHHPDATIEIRDLPVVDMNPLRARQLYTNLVQNALVHSGRTDVTVTVEAEYDQDGGVVVAVADNGKGIPIEYREKVFGVFERLERTDRDTAGTGIGLAVCRKIVEQAGGYIALGDNRPGTRFTIHYPASVVRRGPNRLEVAR